MPTSAEVRNCAEVKKLEAPLDTEPPLGWNPTLFEASFFEAPLFEAPLGIRSPPRARSPPFEALLGTEP